MGVEYQIKLKNTAGTVIAILASNDGILQPFSYTHVENTPGRLQLNLSGYSDLISQIGVDYQVEVWRAIPDQGVVSYKEWEGFTRSPDRSQTYKGGRTYLVTCVEYLDLCNRAGIAYRKDEARATKNGPTETVMKEFVSENIGPDATNPPRLKSNALSGVSVQADGGGGPNWQGERGYKNLLKTLQEIASVGGWDFDIVGTGAAQFEFRTYQDQRGSDRTLPVNPATGRNAAGLIPVVFSTESGNMQTPRYQVNRNKEGGICYVLGDPTSPRTVVIRENIDSTAASPWNKWEFFVNAQNAIAGDLPGIGDAALESNRFQELFSFRVLQTDELMYGRDYFFGDRVTAVFEEIQRNKKITGVSVSVDREENIDINIQDVEQVNRTTVMGMLVDTVTQLKGQVEDLETLE